MCKAPGHAAALERGRHARLAPPAGGAVQPAGQAAIHANPLNLFVVVEAGDHHVTVLDGDRFQALTRFASHYAVHGGPKFSPDGRFVYFSSRDGWVTQYDLYSLQVVADIRVG
jgi:sugar lactone lactonase YvrE